MLLAPWIVVLVYFAEVSAMPPLALALPLAAAMLISLLGYVMAAQPIRNRVILTDDGIDYRSTFGSRQIALADIAGVRRLDMPSGRFSLQMRDGKRFEIAAQFPLDAHFNAWLARLPDLDAEDETERTRQVQQNALLGDNPVARIANAESAYKNAYFLSIASMVLSGWGLFYPAPYVPLVVLLCLMPALALGLCWRAPEKFTLRIYDRTDPQATLMFVFYLPAFVLAQRAYYDIYLVSVVPLIIPTVLVAAALVLVAGLHKERNWKGAACALAMAVYPAAAIVYLNAATEREPQQLFMAKVARKGEGDTTSSRYVRVGVGSTMTYPLHVSATDFAHYREGDAVCLSRKAGGLGIAWFTLHQAGACSSGGGPAEALK